MDMLHSLLHWLVGLRQGRRAAPQMARPSRFAPRIESLEDRSLPSTTVIGGSVYEDINNNGIRDGVEPGIASDLIQLQRPDSTVIAQGVTAANGHYQFTQDQTIDTTPKAL